MTAQTPDQEKWIPQNNKITTKIDTAIDKKTNEHSIEVSEPLGVSGNGKSILFNNPLISEEDLLDPNGYNYDLEIINNIDRSSNSDQ